MTPENQATGHSSYPHKSSQALNMPSSFPGTGYPHWFPRHLDILAIRTGLSMTESQATGHSSYPHLSSPASGHSSCPHKFPQQLDTLAISTKLSGSDAREQSNWTLQLSAQEFPSTEQVKLFPYSPLAPGNFPYIESRDFLCPPPSHPEVGT